MSYTHPETRKELRLQDSAWNRLRNANVKSRVIKDYKKGLTINKIAMNNFLPLEKILQIIRVYLKKPTAIPSVQTG